MAYPFESRLDAPLLALSSKDAFTVADSFESVLVLGQPGSGKTSTSYSALLTAYMNCGWGGLITTAKPGDADKVRQIARRCGRERSLIVVNAKSGHRFNFLRYIMATSPDPSSLLLNLVSFLSTIIETMSGRIAPGGGENAFWTKSVKEALLNTAMLLWAAYGNVTLYDLFAVLHSRPMDRKEAGRQSWLTTSFMAQTLERAVHAPRNPMPSMDYKVVTDYLVTTLANPDARTVGNIMATLSADLAPLMTGQMRELFNTGLNITPEHAIEGGAIIVLDFPVEVYGEVGALAQQIFKYAFQKAVLRRHATSTSRPTFLLMDEASLFLSPYDPEFLSLARESRCATTFLVQNVSSIYAKIGGSNPQHAANQLIGNFGTKIFHANGDQTTNELASNAIGRDIQLRFNHSINRGASDSMSLTNAWGYSKSSQGGGAAGSHNGSTSTTDGFTSTSGMSRGYSEQMDFELQPGAFTKLRKGGKANNYEVDAIIFRVGTRFRHSSRNWMPVTFRQR